MTDKHHVGVYINADLHKELEDLCDSTSSTKSRILRLAISEYVDRQKLTPVATVRPWGDERLASSLSEGQ